MRQVIYKTNRKGKSPHKYTFSYNGIVHTGYLTEEAAKGQIMDNLPGLYRDLTIKTISKHGIVYLGSVYDNRKYF